MREKSTEIFDERPTPESVRSLMEEAGQQGYIQIKFFDSVKPSDIGVWEIKDVDDGGINFKIDEGQTWDEIEWVKASPHKAE